MASGSGARPAGRRPDMVGTLAAVARQPQAVGPLRRRRSGADGPCMDRTSPPFSGLQPFPRALNPRRTEQDMGRFAVLRHDGRGCGARPGDRREPGGWARRSRRHQEGWMRREWSIPSTLVTEPDAKDDQCRASGRPCMGRAGSSPFPARHRDGFRGHDAENRIRLQEPQPVIGLRLRRICRTQKPADLKELAEARAGAA